MAPSPLQQLHHYYGYIRRFSLHPNTFWYGSGNNNNLNCIAIAVVNAYFLLQFTHIYEIASHVSYKRLCNVLATSIPESLQPINSHPLQLYPADARKSTVWLPTEFLSICHQWFIYIQLHYTYLMPYDTF